MRTKTEIRNVRLYLFWSLLKIPRIFSITGNCKQKIWLKQLKAAPALDFSYFQHVSKLVTHHMLCNQKRYCTGKPRNHNGFWAFSYPDFQVQTKRYFSLLRGLELPTPTISGGFQEDFSSESRLFFVFAENFF